jgi:hypothetical protein
MLGEGRALFNGVCYILFETPLSWADARAACGVIDSHLASVADDAENTAVTDLFALPGITATEGWVGLTDQYGEGTFLWAEGAGAYRSLTFASWATDPPDDNAPEGEDCVKLADDGTWSDEVCSDARPYFCEHAWR